MGTSTRTLFMWTIEKFLSTRSKMKIGDEEDSKVFSVPSKDGNDSYTFYLRLYPKGKHNGCSDYVSLFLYSPEEKVRIAFSLYIEKKNESLEIIHYAIEDQFEKGSGLGFDNAVKTSLLMDKHRTYLPKGALTLVAIVEIINEQNFSLPQPLKERYNDAFDTRNSNNSQNFERFSDLRITCRKKPKETFYCHKIMVSMGSPVFEAMLTNQNTKEAIENHIEISDIDADTIRSVLHFLYTGNIPNDLITTQLLGAADKYHTLFNCIFNLL